MPAGKSQYRKGEYPTFEDYSIYAQRVVLNGEFVQHSHDFDEIVLILCGTGEHLVGQRVYSLKRGDVFVIKGETRHGFRGAENLELVNVMYDPRILLSGEGDLRAVAGFAYLFLVQPAIAQQEEYPYAVFLDEDATETASTLCGFLIRQLEDCAGQYQVAVQYGFKTLAAYLANHYRTREGRCSICSTTPPGPSSCKRWRRRRLSPSATWSGCFLRCAASPPWPTCWSCACATPACCCGGLPRL